MIKTLIITILVSLSITTMGKNAGKFIKHTQVTDKEVLIESTKGVQVLFSAFDNNSIGVTYYNKGEKVELISPNQILSHHELGGSVYVEQLDELMQITTTSKDGLLIEISTKKFGFTFIDKASKEEIVLEEEQLATLCKNNNGSSFVVNNLKELELFAEKIF